MPNLGLLKSPMNWMLVGFSLFLLSFIGHIVLKDK